MLSDAKIFKALFFVKYIYGALPFQKLLFFQQNQIFPSGGVCYDALQLAWMATVEPPAISPVSHWKADSQRPGPFTRFLHVRTKNCELVDTSHTYTHSRTWKRGRFSCQSMAIAKNSNNWLFLMLLLATNSYWTSHSTAFHILPQQFLLHFRTLSLLHNLSLRCLCVCVCGAA